MRTQRTIITTLAIAAALALPAAAASGSPLLSGYGGPGAGEQQLVSGGLVGGGGGSGSGRGGGPGASTPGSSGSGGQSSQGGAVGGATGGSGGSGGAQGAAGGSRAGSTGSGRARRGGRPSGARGGGSGAHAVDATHVVTAVPSSTLGLSGGQLLLAAILALALLLSAWATRRLAGLKLREESVDIRAMSSGKFMNPGKGH